MKNKKQLILDAVVKLTQQNGGSFNITISQIAQCAGIGKGTVYEYFGSKEEIFIEVMKSRIFVWIEKIEGEILRTDLTFDQKIDVFLDTAIKIIDFNINMQTMQQQMANMIKNNEKLVKQLFEMRAMYKTRLKKLQKDIYDTGVFAGRINSELEFLEFSISFEIFMSGTMTVFFRRQQEENLDKTQYKQIVDKMFYKIFS